MALIHMHKSQYENLVRDLWCGKKWQETSFLRVGIEG